MRILCLDIPAPGASLEKYAPHLNAEALHAWGLYKSGFIRDIYFRQDRPGVAIFLECDSVDEASYAMRKSSCWNNSPQRPEWIHEAPGKNRWGKARPEQTVMNDTHERAVPGDSNLYHFYCFV